MLQSSLQGSAYVVMDLAFRLLTNGSRVKRCTFLSSFWFQFVDNEGDEIKENQAKLLGSNMKHVHWLIHWANLHAARIFCYRVSQVVNISIVSLMYLLKSSSCCLILPWCLNVHTLLFFSEVIIATDARWLVNQTGIEECMVFIFLWLNLSHIQFLEEKLAQRPLPSLSVSRQQSLLFSPTSVSYLSSIQIN